MSEEELPSYTAVQCANVIGDSEPASATIVSTASQASGENSIVPVRAPVAVDEQSTEDTSEQMFAAYTAGVTVRVICEESNALLSQTALIVNDQIGPLRRACENATKRSGGAVTTNLNINDEAEATLRKAIMDSARQMGRINIEMKKLSDMLKQWIPVPRSADSKGENMKASFDELIKKKTEVEQDVQGLRVLVAAKDDQIKLIQEQINAKDEQIKIMQENHRAEIEKSTANARKLNEELTWKNEKERLQTELDKIAKQNEEIQKQLSNRSDELQKELDAKKAEVESLRTDLKQRDDDMKWMDVKIKKHEAMEEKHKKVTEQWIETMEKEFKKLHEAVQCKGDEIVKVHREMGENFNKESEVEKLKEQMSTWDIKLKTSLQKWNSEIYSMQTELVKKADELIRLQATEKQKQSEINALQNDLKGKDNIIQQLEFERDALKDRCETLKMAHQTADKCVSATGDIASAHNKAMEILTTTNKKQPIADKRQPQESAEDRKPLVIMLPGSPPPEDYTAQS